MKKKLFWILYFGISAAAIALAAILLPEYIVFNWYSLLPIIFFILCVFLAWKTIPGKTITPNSWYQLKRTLVNLRYDRQVGFYEEPEKKDTVVQNALQKSFKIIHVGVMIASPFVFACIFLFPYFVKILSGAPFIIMTIVIWYTTVTADRPNGKKLQQERKEQERREEMGQWR